jgi:myo-inositol 2-dehydrogenase/D-chiro-inositol 1-dehydrogenase
MNSPDPNPNPFSALTPTSNSNRRTFLKTTGTLAVGSALAPAVLTRAAGRSDTIKIGLIGCGGRGTGAASQALNADPDIHLVAMGDAFPEPLQSSLGTLQQSFGERVKVTPDRRFVGLDAYQKVIASDVDVVLLATPPGFRPLHIEAAVNAGKHLFCEKPVATDAPGIRKVLASVKKAKEKNLAWVAGFCWRYDYPRREAPSGISGPSTAPITPARSNPCPRNQNAAAA